MQNINNNNPYFIDSNVTNDNINYSNLTTSKCISTCLNMIRLNPY